MGHVHIDHVKTDGTMINPRDREVLLLQQHLRGQHTGATCGNPPTARQVGGDSDQDHQDGEPAPAKAPRSSGRRAVKTSEV